MMKSILKSLLLASFLVFSPSAFSQPVSQTIRGTVIDKDSRMPLPGANVLLPALKMGTTTNADGNFRIENVPIGRVNLVVSFIGYEEAPISNVLVNVASEVVLHIELTESVNSLNEVVVKDQSAKNKPINEMAVLSARTFSVEETKRFAGAIDDPARMVSGFAGVTNNVEGNNDIIVRGNSPKGILWRLEGVEVPNPNHFADEGSTGGPINALNSAMLSNSDFYTGAFAPQYGNALSAVFDMKMRTGNNQRREYSFQASTLGLDATVEGPLKAGYNGSYLANYRYSTLALLDAAGLVDFAGVPRYQDAAFKVALPVNSKHSFSLFGFGGISAISIEESPEDDENYIAAKGEMGYRMGATGASHTWLLSQKSYLKTSVTASGTSSDFIYEMRNNEGGFYKDYNQKFDKSQLTGTSILHHKVNSKNKLKVGLTYNHLGYDMYSELFNNERDQLETLLNESGNTGSVQSFMEWKHRFNKQFSIVSGAHYLHFLLNDDFAIEPRVAAQWQIDEKQTFTAGAGMHSKLESVSIYLGRLYHDDGSVTMPNQNLGLTRAAHFVLGYDYMLGDYTHLKFETYYQHLYDVPIVNEVGSYESILNYNSGYTTDALVNDGTARNYGAELTLEQYFNKGFYYLGTFSLYESLYTAQDGIERNSAFDGRYVANFIGGKEFKVGKAEKNKVMFVNTKFALIGGNPYTPLDVEATLAQDEEVYDDSRPLGVRGDDIIKWDLAFGIRRNHKKVTTEWKIDIQNLTNNQALVDTYYEESLKTIEYSYQLALFPTLSYRVTF